MIAVVDLEKVEARIDKYLAVRGLGSAAEIMAAIRACSEHVRQEAELQEAFARMVRTKVAEGLREGTDARLKAAERAAERDQAIYMRVAVVISEFRPLLRAKLPPEDARALFDKLDEVLHGPARREPVIFSDSPAA